MLSAIIHLLLGFGLGLLFFESLEPYQSIIGWILIGIGFLGHLWLWKKRQM